MLHNRLPSPGNYSGPIAAQDVDTIETKIREILADPCASYWLKDTLSAALKRDCLDAAYDAKLLASVLTLRADKALGGSF